MDPKLKTVLVLAAGAVIGVTLFGGALASHALVRAVVTGTPAHAGQAMPGPRGGQMGAPLPFGGCQGDEGCGSGACPEGQRPMMDPRGGCPQGDAGACPQGAPGACPDGGCPTTGDTTTES